MLSIAVIGTGHLGKIHLRCLQGLGEKAHLVGFYEPDDATAAAIEQEFGIRRLPTIEAVLEQADALDIVCPTSFHHDWARIGIEANKHLFIEKPVTDTAEQARELLALAQQKPMLKIQIGHVERFNPAVRALADLDLDPKFIEAHRLALFNPRGTDVSVVMDLMIHDLDMLLKWVKSPVRAVHANGVAIVSRSPDIATARIEFENRSVANLTASRISLKNMRKFRIFQPDAYISLDLLNKQTEIVRLLENEADNRIELETALGKRYLEVSMPEIPSLNAIQTELLEWIESIENQTEPTVPLADGVKVVELAERITQAIEAQAL